MLEHPVRIVLAVVCVCLKNVVRECVEGFGETRSNQSKYKVSREERI